MLMPAFVISPTNSRILHGGRERRAQRRDAIGRHAGRNKIGAAQLLHLHHRLEQLALVGVPREIEDQRHVGERGMLAQSQLQQKLDLAVAQPVGMLGGNVVPRPVRNALYLAALHGEDDLRLAGIAGHDAELRAQFTIERARKKLGVRGRAVAAHDHLLLQHVIERALGRGVPGDDDADLARGRAEPVDLAHVEAHALFIEERLERDRPLHRADDAAVLRRDVVDVVGGDDGAGARHVLDDDAGRAGNMPCDVAPYRAGVEIVPAAGGGADDEGQVAACIEFRHVFLAKRNLTGADAHNSGKSIA